MTEPAENDLAARTDSYFLKTKAIVGKFGDRAATYAVFMRRPVDFGAALRGRVPRKHGGGARPRFDIELNYPESAWVGAGEPILYVTGPLYHLVDLETVLLQKLGPPASPPTTPRRCAPTCRRWHSSRWTRAIAPAPRWPR